MSILQRLHCMPHPGKSSGFYYGEANTLALTMRPHDLQEILEEYAKSANGVDLQEQDEQAKKMIAQILKGAVGMQKI